MLYCCCVCGGMGLGDVRMEDAGCPWRKMADITKHSIVLADGTEAGLHHCAMTRTAVSSAPHRWTGPSWTND